MGKQPNIELDLSRPPRRVVVPGVARRWQPGRPGELGSPADVPSGGAFGVVGPDAGYALKLVAERDLHLLGGEHHHDAATAVAAVASARAARDGRAPVAEDVSVAMIALGFESPPAPGSVLYERRPGWLANVAHDSAKLRGIVADVPSEVMMLSPDELRSDSWSFRIGSDPGDDASP